MGHKDKSKNTCSMCGKLKKKKKNKTFGCSFPFLYLFSRLFIMVVLPENYCPLSTLKGTSSTFCLVKISLIFTDNFDLNFVVDLALINHFASTDFGFVTLFFSFTIWVEMLDDDSTSGVIFLTEIAVAKRFCLTRHESHCAAQMWMWIKNNGNDSFV